MTCISFPNPRTKPHRCRKHAFFSKNIQHGKRKTSPRNRVAAKCAVRAILNESALFVHCRRRKKAHDLVSRRKKNRPHRNRLLVIPRYVPRARPVALRLPEKDERAVLRVERDVLRRFSKDAPDVRIGRRKETLVIGDGERAAHLPARIVGIRRLVLPARNRLGDMCGSAVGTERYRRNAKIPLEDERILVRQIRIRLADEPLKGNLALAGYAPDGKGRLCCLPLPVQRLC